MKNFNGTERKWYVHGCPSENKCHIGGKETYFIATVHGYGRNFEQVKANARLISAAPRLLKVLQSIQLSLKAHPDYVSGENQEFVDYVSIAEDVINKALGVK
jgi:hypothetical protein